MSKQLVMDRQREAAWRKWVGGHLGSGLTIQKYCRQHGLVESAFYFWKAQLKRRKLQPGFVPVAVSVPGPAPAVVGQVEILLAGGHRVRLSGAVDRQMLHDVVAVLEARPC